MHNKYVVVALLFLLLCTLAALYCKPGLRKADASCIAEKHEHFSFGYGVEHTYSGEITKDRPVKVILSCDHQKFFIDGAVQQTIDSNDYTEVNGLSIDELADLSMGSEVIDISDDFNFDGYNDLSTVVINGAGIDAYLIFLYDVQKNIFVLSQDLAGKHNIVVDKERKQLHEIYHCGFDGEEAVVQSSTYRWEHDQLVRVSQGFCE